jgi:DNA primase
MLMELLDYLGRIGVQLRRAGHHEFKCLCPLHSEETPSFYANPAKGKWICRGACHRGGDLLELIMRYERVSFAMALAIAGTEHIPKSIIPAVRRDPLSYEDKLRLTRAAYEYQAELARDTHAWDYLTRQRGLDATTILRHHLGLCPEHPADVEPPLGNGTMPSLGKYVTIPDFQEGLCTYIQGKRPAPGEPRYLALPGLPRPIFGFGRFQQERALYLVEGVFDWLSLLQWGLPAVSSLGSHLSASQAALLSGRRIILAQDADAAGDLAAQQIALAIPDSTRLRPPEPLKDWNDCLVAGWTRERFLDHERRSRVGTL